MLVLNTITKEEQLTFIDVSSVKNLFNNELFLSFISVCELVKVYSNTASNNIEGPLVWNSTAVLNSLWEKNSYERWIDEIVGVAIDFNKLVFQNTYTPFGYYSIKEDLQKFVLNGINLYDFLMSLPQMSRDEFYEIREMCSIHPDFSPCANINK